MHANNRVPYDALSQGASKDAGAAVAVAFAIFLGAGSAQSAPLEIKQNPDPLMPYTITAHFDGAPGPFDRAEASVSYRVDTPDAYR
ncbi:hypothetical protein J2793_007483 [Paraburkholderia caledonica]|uniref:Uncharacterized protein n=1 Tax=Paraburkholderia caledonica TaxID=134536 RepID=A0AB73IPS2_9BURK|nr:hypothetical protein [Paraburkholderia caledonica]